RALAFSYCAADTPMLTGSKRAMASATARNAACAGLPPRRQLSGRCGQSIQVWVCASHSAGMRKPSARGVLSVMSGLQATVEGLQRTVQVRATITEHAPGAADLLQRVQIEAVHQNAFFGVVQLLDFGAELIGDEGRAIEGDGVAVLLLVTDAVAGDQRHQVGAGMALLHALPVLAGGDAGVVGLAANGGRVEQQFGTLQRHAARTFGEPLVPADAHANLRVA